MTIAPRAGHARFIFVFAGSALLLGAAQFMADRAGGPLDDQDLAFQRPGFLDAHGAPFNAPVLTPRIGRPGERLIVFFVREEQTKPLHDALMQRTHPLDEVATVVVYAGRGIDHSDVVTQFIPDVEGTIASSYRMPRPRDGGPPVGYAIVDRLGMVRYRTLDPTVWKRLDEVETMWAVTP